MKLPAKRSATSLLPLLLGDPLIQILAHKLFDRLHSLRVTLDAAISTTNSDRPHSDGGAQGRRCHA